MKNKTTTLFLVMSLLGSASICAQTVIEFSYDPAGNQTLRDKKEDPLGGGDGPPIIDSPSDIAERIFAFPNPTASKVTLSWDAGITKQITKIELISMMTSQTQPVSWRFTNSVSIELYSKPSGLYLVVFHLNNQQIQKVQKKIIRM